MLSWRNAVVVSLLVWSAMFSGTVKAGVITATLTESLFVKQSPYYTDPDRVLSADLATVLTDADEVVNLNALTSYFALSFDLTNNQFSIALTDPTAPVQTDFARVAIDITNIEFDLPDQFLAGISRLTDLSDLYDANTASLTESLSSGPTSFSIILDTTDAGFRENGSATYQLSFDVHAVPEPASATLFGISSLLCGYALRRKKSTKIRQ